MNEKTLIKSKKALSGKVVLLIGFIVSLVIGYIVQYLIEGQTFLITWDGKLRGFNSEWYSYYLAICAIPFVLFLIVFWMINACEITITDKRVYGKAAFGKRVDLPLDSISAVGTGIFKGLTVATSSGKIKFFMLDNRDELHSEISKLLIDRQQKPKEATTIKQEIQQSNADELKKYKDLLDNGIITKEEFDAKKKQLLGL